MQVNFATPTRPVHVKVKSSNWVSSPLLSPSPGASSTNRWAYDMVIPTRFSQSTMKCLEDQILTGPARDEIVNSLATLIMLHTVTPSSSEYNTVCDRLVKKLPCLKDCIGSGYVSLNVSSSPSVCMHVCATLLYMLNYSCISTGLMET